MPIGNQAFTARDLQAGATVLSQTADAATAGEKKFLIVLGNGTGSGDDPDKDAGTISIRLTINGQVAEGGLVNISKEAFGSDTPIRITLSPNVIADGETVTIFAKTAHASDGAVKVAVYPCAWVGQTGDNFARLGAPVALDGGSASIAGMLTKMADDNGGADFNATTDSQQKIADTIGQTAPISHVCDNVFVSAGNVTGAHGDIHGLNGAYYTATDASFGIDIQFVFNIGADRLPGDVTVIGRFSGSGSDRVHFYVWNYFTETWNKISNDDTAFKSTPFDVMKINSLTSEHVDIAGTPGNVLVRFLSTAVNPNDEFRIDQLVLTSVPAAGITLGGIAEVVWAHDITAEEDEVTAGNVLRHTQAFVAHILTEDSTTSFTLDVGVAANDAYNGMVIMIHDATDNHHEVRRIVDYTSGRVITVDRAFSFTPAVDDGVYVMATGYVNIEEIDTLLSANHGSNTWGVGLPSDVTTTVLTKDDEGATLEGASVWSSSDNLMQNILRGPFVSNSQGISTCLLPLGPQYLWVLLPGYTISNPQSVTIA